MNNEQIKAVTNLWDTAIEVAQYLSRSTNPMDVAYCKLLGRALNDMSEHFEPSHEVYKDTKGQYP